MTTSNVDLNKVKQDLEPFRKAIMSAHGLLIWEKQYYAGLVFGGVSVTYLMLWYLDLPIITLLSLLALMTIILDFAFPIVSRLLFDRLNWDGEQDAKFEEVCSQMNSVKTNLVAWYEYLFKGPKSFMCVIVISIGLLALAWVGATINNLLLMYLTTLVFAMWPGIRDKDVIKSVKQKAFKMIADKMQSGLNKMQ